MRTILSLLSAALVATPNGASPQAVRAAAAQSASPSAPAAAPALSIDRKITVRFDATSLHDALQAIARQSGAQISYRAATLPSKHRVTLSVTDAPARSVLKMVLQGTGVEMSVTPTGEVALYRNVGGKVKVQGVIAGRVVDAKTSKPIAGASVSIGAVSDRGVTTGEDGVYRLTGIANGTHTVTVRIIGYAKQTKQVTVAEGATVSADFKLDPSASVLDQVIVTGHVVATERKAVPNAMTVVTAKDIADKGITRIDQLFRGEIPGVFAFQSPGGIDIGGGTAANGIFGGAQVLSRGVTKIQLGLDVFDRTGSGLKTYVDGVEIADASFLSNIDPKSIERIEILTGPQASTIYGSGALSGVMQVFTKKGSRTAKPELTLSLQSGVVNSNISSKLSPQHDHSVQLLGGGDELTYNLGGGYAYIGPWVPEYRSRTYSAYGGARRVQGVVTAEASARFSKREVTNAVRYSFYLDSKTRYNGLEQINPALFIPRYGNNITGVKTLGLVVSVVVKPWWQQKLTLGTDETNVSLKEEEGAYSRTSDTLARLYERPASKVTVQYNSTLAYDISSFLSGSLTAGVDYMDYQTSSSNGLYTSLVGTLTGTPAPTLSRNLETNRGYFAQGQLNIGEALFLTTGIRKEKNTNYGKNYAGGWAPRYGASYVYGIRGLTGKIRAAFGAATRTPAPSLGAAVYGQNAFYPAGYLTVLPNNNLQPERSSGPEAGIELYFGDRANLQITYYRQIVDHLISSVKVDSVRSTLPDASLDCGTPGIDGFCYALQDQHRNVGTMQNRGWEGQGEIRMLERLTLGGTWSYTRSRLQQTEPGYVCGGQVIGEAFSCFYPGSSFTNFPEHTAAARVVYSDAKSTVHLSLSHIGSRTVLGPKEGGFSSLVRLPIYWPQRVGRFERIKQSGYQTVDLQATRSIWSQGQLFLKINNLTDRQEANVSRNAGYQEFATIGRQSMLGLSMKMF